MGYTPTFPENLESASAIQVFPGSRADGLLFRGRKVVKFLVIAQLGNEFSASPVPKPQVNLVYSI